MEQLAICIKLSKNPHCPLKMVTACICTKTRWKMKTHGNCVYIMKELSCHNHEGLAKLRWRRKGLLSQQAPSKLEARMSSEESENYRELPRTTEPSVNVSHFPSINLSPRLTLRLIVLPLPLSMPEGVSEGVWKFVWNRARPRAPWRAQDAESRNSSKCSLRYNT